MSLLDFNKILREDWQYKPNFGFGAYMNGDHPWIRIVMLVENSREPFRQWEVKAEPARRELYFEDFEFSIDYNATRYIPKKTFVGYSPSRELVEIMGQYPIPYFEEGDEATFIEWLLRTVWEMEKHEMYEWARYKGELVDDPHKEVTV